MYTDVSTAKYFSSHRKKRKYTYKSLTCFGINDRIEKNIYVLWIFWTHGFNDAILSCMAHAKYGSQHGQLRHPEILGGAISSGMGTHNCGSPFWNLLWESGILTAMLSNLETGGLWLEMSNTFASGLKHPLGVKSLARSVQTTKTYNHQSRCEALFGRRETDTRYFSQISIE